MKEIFIGRCFYYIHYHPKRLKNCEFNSSNYDCNLIWETFYNITTKNAKNLSDYDPLINLTSHYVPENASLFWSGVYEQASDCKY